MTLQESPVRCRLCDSWNYRRKGTAYRYIGTEFRVQGDQNHVVVSRQALLDFGDPITESVSIGIHHFYQTHQSILYACWDSGNWSRLAKMKALK